MAKSKLTTAIDVDHPALALYYATLAEYKSQGVHHEGAVSTAFENLLTALARQRGWVFIPLLSVTGRRIIPDGTIRDSHGLPRAYWEAKDTDDDLEQEIKKKIAKGYPLNNIIFEDTSLDYSRTNAHSEKAAKLGVLTQGHLRASTHCHS